MSSSNEVFSLINQNLQDIEGSLTQAMASSREINSKNEAINVLLTYLIERFNFLLNFYINTLKEKKRLIEQLTTRGDDDELPSMEDAEFEDDDAARQEINRLQADISALTTSINEAESELTSQSVKSEEEKLTLVQQVSEQASQITQLLAKIDELEKRVIPPGSDEIIERLKQVNQRLNAIKVSSVQLVNAQSDVSRSKYFYICQ